MFYVNKYFFIFYNRNKINKKQLKIPVIIDPVELSDELLSDELLNDELLNDVNGLNDTGENVVILFEVSDVIVVKKSDEISVLGSTTLLVGVLDGVAFGVLELV